jgi:hypothetical protein
MSCDNTDLVAKQISKNLIDSELSKEKIKEILEKVPEFYEVKRAENAEKRISVYFDNLMKILSLKLKDSATANFILRYFKLSKAIYVREMINVFETYRPEMEINPKKDEFFEIIVGLPVIPVKFFGMDGMMRLLNKSMEGVKIHSDFFGPKFVCNYSESPYFIYNVIPNIIMGKDLNKKKFEDFSKKGSFLNFEQMISYLIFADSALSIYSVCLPSEFNPKEDFNVGQFVKFGSEEKSGFEFLCGRFETAEKYNIVTFSTSSNN